MFKEFQEQRTRNVVRQVANQLHPAMSEKNAWIELQRISIDDFKPLVAKPRTQKFCKSGILLDRENVRAFFEKKPGQLAQARPDLDHIICRSDLRLIDNPASEVLIVQKVLTESFGRPDADFLKRRAYL
jgi:hypothetical protein